MKAKRKHKLEMQWFLILAAVLLLVTAFIIYLPQISVNEKDMAGQAAGFFGGTAPFEFNAAYSTGENKINAEVKRGQDSGYRYIIYRYGYIYEKVNGWVKFPFSFTNGRAIQFDNKETKDENGRDIWIDLTDGTATAAIPANVDDFFTDKQNSVVAFLCRCSGEDCNNPRKGWNSKNWECNSADGAKGVDNGQWVLKGFDVKRNSLRIIKIGPDGIGFGTVSSSPAGIDCGTDCSESYSDETTVTLTAYPGLISLYPVDNNSIFTGWWGDCTGFEPTCTLNVNGAKSVTATYFWAHRLDAYAYAGTISVSPEGVSCGDYCHLYQRNTVVTLTATPDAEPQLYFKEWSGADCSGPEECKVTMDNSKSVRAYFLPIDYGLDVTRTGSGSGTVTGSYLKGGGGGEAIVGITCGDDCSESYQSGVWVTLTATPNEGSTFLGWSGACSGANRECVVTMDGAKSVTASFGLHGQVTLRPNGGISGGWQPIITGCAKNGQWNCVADTSPDTGGATTLYSSISSGQSFAFSDTELPSSTTINYVELYYLYKNYGTSQSSFKMVVMDRALSAGFYGSNTFAYKTNMFLTNPATGGVWTVAEVDALEAGMSGTGVISQVYAIVYYNG